MNEPLVTTARLAGASRRAIRFVDLVLLVALAFGALKTNLRLEHLVDLDATDETQYLAIGLAMPRDGRPEARREVFFAPLYSTWYLGLAQVQPEPSQLPGLNFRILGVLVPWLFYGLLRRGGCTPWVSALAAFCLMAHQLSLEPSTRSIHFAVGCLALGLWLALAARTRVRQCCALAFGATLAAFTRPEYAVLALLMLASAGALQSLRRFREDRRDWRFLAGAGGVALALVLWFGPPVGAGNNRSFLAFSQHFSAGYLQRHPAPKLNPWWDFDAVVAQVFDGAKTLPEAWRKNPTEFSTHLSANLRDIVTRALPLSLAHRNFLLPEGHRWQIAERALCAGLFAVLALVRRRRLGPNARWLWQQRKPVVLFVAAVLGLATAGMVLTSAGERYFFPIFFCGGFCVMLLLGRNEPGENPAPIFPSPLWLGGFALGLLGLAPASHYRDQAITSTRSVVAEVSRHSFREGTGLLEAVGMKRMEIYLAPELRFVLPAEKREPFEAFLVSHQIGAIHLTPYLRSARGFADDPAWAEFLATPAAFGFTAIALPFEETLYLRDAALLSPDKL